MIAGIDTENGSCDPDHATFRGGLSSENEAMLNLHGDGHGKKGEAGATKHQVSELCEGDQVCDWDESDADDAGETAVVRRPDDRRWSVDVDILQQLRYIAAHRPIPPPVLYLVTWWTIISGPLSFRRYIFEWQYVWDK